MSKQPSYFKDHARRWAELRYVYPVVSRRSAGLSIGVNLNLDGVCNFDCVYCQVLDRRGRPTHPVMVGELEAELHVMLDAVEAGVIWEAKRFAEVPIAKRVLKDIAFSGDGEPTACRTFAESVAAVAGVKRERGLDDVRLVVLTNATLLDREPVRAGLATLAENNGVLWAKLDAGTQGYYEKIDRSAVPLEKVVANIAAAASPGAGVVPGVSVVIQTMLCRIDGAAMSDVEFAAYADRVAMICETRGVEAVHLYTVAREAMEANVSAVSEAELSWRAGQLRERLGDVVEVAVFG